MSSPIEREALLRNLSAMAPPQGQLEYLGSVPLGSLLRVEQFQLANGLRVLICEDHSAPVLAYHTWFRVGSRHELPGKTGLAHLFEHLMFNEMEDCPYGEFDRRLEEAGAESNAATWLDWTQYTITLPASQLDLVVGLEASRMGRLVLQDPQVTSEKEVVMNERRYRVEDDVEGAVSELLWSTAFERHPYHWPTIGWMQDIEGFTTEDCRRFYRTFYAPNNATIVVVGDTTEGELLPRISRSYGHLDRATLPVPDYWPEPPQNGERRQRVAKPTPTEKVAIGYHGPAIGDQDHVAMTLLGEVLFGGRASRMHQALVRDREIATDVRVFVGPFRDPGLIEVFASARPGHAAEELLSEIDVQFQKVLEGPVSPAEIERARSRLELSLLAGLETVDGKASTIGFYDTVIGRPAAAFERLAATAAVTPADLLLVARRYLAPEARSIIEVRTAAPGAEAS